MRRLLRGFGLLVIGLVVFVPGFVLWHSRDLPEIDRAGLDWEPREIAREDNAYFDLVEATKLLDVPDESWQRIGDARRGDPSALAEAAPILERNRDALDAFERALNKPDLQFPIAIRSSPTRYEPDDAWRWQQMAHLISLRAWTRPRVPQAVADFLTVAELGRRVEAADGADLIQGMRGIAIKNTAFITLIDWTSAHSLSADEGRGLSDALARYRHDPQAWRRILAVDLHYSEQIMAQGIGKAKLGERPYPEVEDPLWYRVLPIDYLYHHNRTMTAVARSHARTAEACARLPRDPTAAVESESSALPWEWWVFLPNGAGRLVAEAGPNLQRFAMRICAGDARVSATQAIVALRAWYDDHGSLPEDLVALVPTYLAEVPLDPFDGKPLRYDPGNRWLHSVGQDLTDEGGKPDAVGDPEFRSEPTFVLRFGSEKLSPGSG